MREYVERSVIREYVFSYRLLGKKIPLFACLHMGDNYEVTKLIAIDWVICHFKTSFTLRS